MAVRLSLIIPAYNEADRIGLTLTLCRDYLQNQPYESETIVVDDGSRDETAAVVRRDFPHVQVISYRDNRGKGYAVKQGMLTAKGQYRVFYDADGSTPISELEKVWPEFERGADLVIGSRSLPESDVQVRQRVIREYMGRIFNLLTRSVLHEDYIDTQCGFKAFTAASADSMFRRQTIEGFCFDAELLYIAAHQGLNVREVAVRWLNSPNSRVALVGDSMNMLLDLGRIRLNGLLGKYRA